MLVPMLVSVGASWHGTLPAMQPRCGRRCGSPLRASFSSVMCGGKKSAMRFGVPIVRSPPPARICSMVVLTASLALSPVVMADRLTWGMRPEFTHCKLLTSTSVRTRTCHSPLSTRSESRRSAANAKHASWDLGARKRVAPAAAPSKPLSPLPGSWSG